MNEVREIVLFAVMASIMIMQVCATAELTKQARRLADLFERIIDDDNDSISITTLR